MYESTKVFKNVPQTKQQLRQLLSAAGISPRHKWGQNFLIDLNLMRLLVQSAHLKGDETVLEVGCGTGSLTELLLEQAASVIAVEIDPDLHQIAASQILPNDKITFIEGDVLTNKNTISDSVFSCLATAQSRLPGPFFLIANLPYQIASPLIVNLLLSEHMPDAFFVTVQAEVAQRILAQPGCKAYGLLTILLQAIGNPQKIRDIKPQAFWPAPKVTSSMISWRRDDEKCSALNNLKVLKQVIDVLLSHRRKKIRNCLTDKSVNRQLDLTLEILQQADIDPDARGDTLPPQKFIQLANLYAEK